MSCVNGNLVDAKCVCYRWYYGDSCQSLFLDYWGVFFVLYIGIFFLFYYLVLLWACYELRFQRKRNELFTRKFWISLFIVIACLLRCAVFVQYSYEYSTRSTVNSLIDFVLFNIPLISGVSAFLILVQYWMTLFSTKTTKSKVLAALAVVFLVLAFIGSTIMSTIDVVLSGLIYNGALGLCMIVISILVVVSAIRLYKPVKGLQSKLQRKFSAMGVFAIFDVVVSWISVILLLLFTFMKGESDPLKWIIFHTLFRVFELLLLGTLSVAVSPVLMIPTWHDRYVFFKNLFLCHMDRIDLTNVTMTNSGQGGSERSGTIEQEELSNDVTSVDESEDGASAFSQKFSEDALPTRSESGSNERASKVLVSRHESRSSSEQSSRNESRNESRSIEEV